jgi:hypothetical protein
MDSADLFLIIGLLCVLGGAGLALYRICFIEPIGNVRMGIPMTLAQWRMRMAWPGIALACFGIFLFFVAALPPASAN